MKKRKLKIINFLYLSNEKFKKIREYRNQNYIREVSLNSSLISEKEHYEYKELLEKEDNYFAFLIINDDKDYGVISFKKNKDESFTVGDYLVDEKYKYEGGGIVNRYCIMYICNNLSINYLKSEFKVDNKRGHRAGTISKVDDCIRQDDFFTEYSQVLDYFDKDVLLSKSRILFDKLYAIEEVKI